MDVTRMRGMLKASISLLKMDPKLFKRRHPFSISFRGCRRAIEGQYKLHLYPIHHTDLSVGAIVSPNFI